MYNPSVNYDAILSLSDQPIPRSESELTRLTEDFVGTIKVLPEKAVSSVLPLQKL